jgi:peptidoglycan/LPS O-acetylase OafA/YrhL
MTVVRKAAFVVGSAAIGVCFFVPAASAQTTTAGDGISPTFYLAGAVVCAVACWFVAKSKGRSQVLWAILGFVFGIIPLIIVAILKKKQPESFYGTGGGPATLPPPPPPPPTS